jgi:hypothetical protein
VTNIGRGRLGLLDELFDFEEFAGFTASEKRAYLELQGGVVKVGWASQSEHVDYKVALEQSFDGIPLRPRGVITSEETLSEVETRVACEAAVGRWFYDPATDLVHVRLTGDADPEDTVIVVLLAFVFGTRGSFEPLLGIEKLPDPAIEEWSSSTVPTHYAVDNVGAPGVHVQREDTVKVAGAYSLKVGIGNIVGINDNLGNQAGGGITKNATIGSGLEGVAGDHYIAWGHYLTDFGSTVGLEARLRVTADGTNYLESDGRATTTATNGFAMRETHGVWRQFLFAFRCPTDTTNLRVSWWLFNNSGGTVTDAGQAVYFDEIHVARVQAYRYFEPRLTLDGLPELQRAANDVFFGSETAGLGALRLLNRDDSQDLNSDPFLETMFGAFDFCSRSAYMRYGGTLPNDQDIPYPCTEPAWAGILKAFMVDALAASMELESSRGILSVELPLERYGRDEFANLAEADLDRPKPIVLGTLTNVRPARIDASSDDLGIYEAIDATYAANTSSIAANPSAIYAYTDDDAAARKDSARRITLSAANDYDLTTDSYATTGRFRMIANPGPFEIEAGVNDCLDVTTDAGTFAVFLDPGLYTSRTLMAHVDSRLTTVAGGSWTITYDLNDHLVDITKSAGTLSLLVQSGANNNRSAYPLLGFTQDDETTLTGSLTYSGETALPFNPDEQHIRMDITGYKDSAAGTYTGTGSALIQKAPDVTQFLLRQVLHIPARDIDSFSFVAARTTSPQNLGVYLGGLASIQGGAGGGSTLQDILDKLEVGAYGDITVDALGRWFWVPRIDDVSGHAATVAVVLTNADFLEFAAGRSLEDVYHIVRMTFAQDPSTGLVQTREMVNEQTPVRFDRRHTITFNSYLTSASDVETLVTKLARPAVRPINRYEIVVKGKLMRMKLGELIDVSARLRKLAEPSDQSEPYIIRLQELTWNPLTHICRAVGYTQYFGLPPI